MDGWCWYALPARLGQGAVFLSRMWRQRLGVGGRGRLLAHGGASRLPRLHMLKSITWVYCSTRSTVDSRSRYNSDCPVCGRASAIKWRTQSFQEQIWLSLPTRFVVRNVYAAFYTLDLVSAFSTNLFIILSFIEQYSWWNESPLMNQRQAGEMPSAVPLPTDIFFSLFDLLNLLWNISLLQKYWPWN